MTTAPRRTVPKAVDEGGGIHPVKAVAAPPPHRRRRGYEALSGYLFVAPAVVLFAVMGLYTVGYGFALSFATWNGFTPNWTWVGLDNYADLLWRDPVYAPAYGTPPSTPSG